MDNPYQIKTAFTVLEAACALAGITQPSQSDHFVLQTTMNELRDAIGVGELSANQVTAYQTRRVRGSLIDPDDRIEKIPTGTDWGKSTIARADLLTQCEQRGIRPALLFPKQAPIEKTAYADDPANYHTPALDALRAAITHFWLNHDPKRPPKSPEIVGWLIQQHSLTKTMAESIDRVIRPDEYRKGGNTSSN